MKKLFTRLTLAFVGLGSVATAQQDPQFTQWMQNKLIYNPGYAGTSGAICGVLQYRQQWASFQGAPQSFAFGGNMRLREIPLGVGLNVITDKIGPMSTFFARAAGSWNFMLGAKKDITLGVGLDVGMLQKSFSADWITPEPGKVDNLIPGAYSTNPNLTNPSLNGITYDVGFGAYVTKQDKFYVGLSSTHLPSQSLTKGDLNYTLTRHYYFMAGYTFHLNPWNKLTPNLFVKSDVSGTAIDANLTYMLWDKIWLGASYRFSDAAAAMLGYTDYANGQKTIKYKVGFSYDFTLSQLRAYAGPTYEFIAGICIIPKLKKVSSYGDPRFLN
ncbi:MAG: type IX secretion system membrane protein PorP/SprF [Bacteroidetes bacterium]|nr:type IX secretion system membrane protein PorP/SprF [Bacteroidota bacterium]